MTDQLFSLFDVTAELRQRTEDAIREAFDASDIELEFKTFKREVQLLLWPSVAEEEALLAMMNRYAGQELSARERYSKC